MSDLIRLQKAIAQAGLMSRRAAEELIAAGRVAVDGAIASLGDRVDVDVQAVTVDGDPIPLRPDLETHLVYKPVGVVSTASDPQGRPTVVGLVPSDTRLYPVGRLDIDSEGLILVSNDGVLTERVTHPRYGIRKKYLVEVSGTPRPGEIRRLETGVELEDGPARALRATIRGTSRGRTQIQIVMEEGRNREVRRMLSAIGYDTLRLVRTAIGPISDLALQPGESRRLSAGEVAQLLKERRD